MQKAEHPKKATPITEALDAVNSRIKVKKAVADADAATLLKTPKAKRAKKPEGYHLAKITHTEIDAKGNAVTGVTYIDGTRPSDPLVPPTATYYRTPLRYPARPGERRGLVIFDDDGNIMRAARASGPIPWEGSRAHRRLLVGAIRRNIRRNEKRMRRSLAA